MRAFYAQWGAIFILVKGLTPIPYKLVTIVSGLIAYNFPLFMLLSIDHARGALLRARGGAQSFWRPDPLKARTAFRSLHGVARGDRRRRLRGRGEAALTS